MKKSLFDRMLDLPTWLISGVVYGGGGLIFFLLFFGMPGCTIYEPLPGLCYTDKTGTYVCIDKEVEGKDLLEELEQRTESYEEILLYMQQLEELQNYDPYFNKLIGNDHNHL